MKLRGPESKNLRIMGFLKCGCTLPPRKCSPALLWFSPISDHVEVPAFGLTSSQLVRRRF